jgi:CRISPR-associated protein Cas5t
MEALKIKLFQEIAVYRNPITMEVIETYPLPAPSTVLGLIHQLLGAKETIPDINISIQGGYDALLRDYQHYKKGDSPRPYPIIVNALNNVNLTLHIMTNETVLARIEDAFHSPPYYPYLGRAEDLLKVEDVKRVSYEGVEVDEEKIRMPCYVRKDLAESYSLNGILFRLPTYYQLEEVLIGKRVRKVRNFKWHDYIYVERDYIDKKSKIIIDSNGDKVWWCMPNQDLPKT